MALLISMGNLGGAIGSNIFLESQKPHYWLGYGMGIGLTSAAIVCTFVLRFAYSRSNKKRDLLSEEEVRQKYNDDEMLGKFNLHITVHQLTVKDMGDKSPLYRYVV